MIIIPMASSLCFPSVFDVVEVFPDRRHQRAAYLQRATKRQPGHGTPVARYWRAVGDAGVRPRFIRNSSPHLNHLPAGPTNEAGTGRRAMHQRRYWLDYDPVALAVLVIGIGIIELLALSI